MNMGFGFDTHHLVEGRPLVTLGKLMEEAIIKYFLMQKKSPSQEDLGKVFANFLWSRIENLPYPPREAEIFRSPI